MLFNQDFLSCLNLETTSKRRDFLKTGAVVAVAAQLWMPDAASAQRYVTRGRELSVLNAHTGERFKGVYFDRGRYNEDAFEEIKHVFRDRRTGEKFPIDPKLLDMMYVVQERTGSRNAEYDLFSGYRSPKTNAKLRRKSTKVAKKSFHMLGQAVDVRLSGTDLSRLRKSAIALNTGGVGYYPSSGFVHLDTGNPRNWS